MIAQLITIFVLLVGFFTVSWKFYAFRKIQRREAWNRARVKLMAGNASDEERELAKGKRPPLGLIKMPKDRKSLKQRWAEFKADVNTRLERMHPLYNTRQRIIELEKDISRTDSSLRFLRGDVRDAERDIKEIIEFVNEKVIHKPTPKPPTPPKKPRSESQLEVLKEIMEDNDNKVSISQFA